MKKDFKNLMEYNDGKRLQTFDGVTTYSYTRSVGCEILMMFKKKSTKLNSSCLQTMLIIT